MTSLNSHRRHFLHAVIILILLLSAVSLYSHWHQLIVQIIEWQKSFHGLLATHISAIKQDPLMHGLSLMALSFGYGVFHAIGPGHGKAVIITYLGSHRESLKRGLLISFLAALLQAVVAILLVVVLSKLFSIRFSEVNGYADDITSASYFLVMGLGAYLFLSSARLQWKKLRQNKQHSHDHSHHHCCGGHHTHQAAPKESWLQSLMVVFSMGSRPCSGAIVVLIYAHLVGEFYYGIMATLVMGLGTGLSISGIGLGTQLARNWFESLIESKPKSVGAQLDIGLWVKIIGGIIIFLLGYSLFQTTLISSSHPLL
ncbi:sulfite exporter TauE/SafE family protein [Psychromonas sp.]|nr:sulfite exporter TauE/SafE family protein [Psychromonas sp.]